MSEYIPSNGTEELMVVIRGLSEYTYEFYPIVAWNTIGADLKPMIGADGGVVSLNDLLKSLRIVYGDSPSFDIDVVRRTPAST